MSAYIYAANVICPAAYRALGNALADAIDPDSGGGLTFADGHGLPCYPPGTTFTGQRPFAVPSNPPTAYAAFPLLKQDGYDAITEFLSAGPYPRINALGFTDAQIAVAKAALKIECGRRADIENHSAAFIAAQGYEVAP